MPKKRILIPLDASIVSREIIPHVQRFFKPEDCTLFFLKVLGPTLEEIIVPPAHAGLEWTPEMYHLVEEWQSIEHESHAHKQEALCRAVEESLRKETIHLANRGYTVEILVDIGDAAEKIEYEIRKCCVDLVAMTTHAREGFSRLFMGSVAGKVLHDMSVPVLLYHPISKHKN